MYNRVLGPDKKQTYILQEKVTQDLNQTITIIK